MTAVTITQITAPEFESLIENSLRKILSTLQQTSNQLEADELLTIEQTALFLKLAKPTIYGLISKGELPVMKRSKRCYFLKADLINYLKQGRKKTNSEIEAETDLYLLTNKKRLQNGK